MSVKKDWPLHNPTMHCPQACRWVCHSMMEAMAPKPMPMPSQSILRLQSVGRLTDGDPIDLAEEVSR